MPPKKKKSTVTPKPTPTPEVNVRIYPPNAVVAAAERDVLTIRVDTTDIDKTLSLYKLGFMDSTEVAVHFATAPTERMLSEREDHPSSSGAPFPSRSHVKTNEAETILDDRLGLLKAAVAEYVRTYKGKTTPEIKTALHQKGLQFNKKELNKALHEVCKFQKDTVNGRQYKFWFSA